MLAENIEQIDYIFSLCFSRPWLKSLRVPKTKRSPLARSPDRSLGREIRRTTWKRNQLISIHNTFRVFVFAQIYSPDLHESDFEIHHQQRLERRESISYALLVDLQAERESYYEQVTAKN